MWPTSAVTSKPGSIKSSPLQRVFGGEKRRKMVRKSDALTEDPDNLGFLHNEVSIVVMKCEFCFILAEGWICVGTKTDVFDLAMYLIASFFFFFTDYFRHDNFHHRSQNSNPDEVEHYPEVVLWCFPGSNFSNIITVTLYLHEYYSATKSVLLCRLNILINIHEKLHCLVE